MNNARTSKFSCANQGHDIDFAVAQAVAAKDAEIERLRAAGKVLVSRAESMVITDRAGNRFQKVFVDDLNALRHALETKP